MALLGANKIKRDALALIETPEPTDTFNLFPITSLLNR